jgi:hypothetical protein
VSLPNSLKTFMESLEMPSDSDCGAAILARYPSRPGGEGRSKLLDDDAGSISGDGDCCGAILAKYPSRPGGGGRLKWLHDNKCSITGDGDCWAAILAKYPSRPGGRGRGLIFGGSGSLTISPDGDITSFEGAHETDFALLDDAG